MPSGSPWGGEGPPTPGPPPHAPRSGPPGHGAPTRSCLPRIPHLVETDPFAAVRHVETCEACISQAATEVMTFQQGPTEAESTSSAGPDRGVGHAHPRRGLTLNLAALSTRPGPQPGRHLRAKASPRASASAPGRQSTSPLLPTRPPLGTPKPVTSSPALRVGQGHARAPRG